MSLSPSTPYSMIDSEEDCGYVPGRTSRQAHIALEKPTASSFAEAKRATFLDYKFERLRAGYLSEAFSAAANICPSCNLCVPLRVNLDAVVESKTQKRMRHVAADTLETFNTYGAGLPVLVPFYRAYMEARHPQSKMATFTEQHIRNIFSHFTDMMVTHSNAPTKIQSVALMDVHKGEATLDMIVYNPNYKQNGVSLGHLSWLEAQSYAQAQGIKYLYVGSYNAGPKLAYKATRNPEALEAFVDGEWKKFDPAKHTQGPDYRAMLKRDGFNPDI